MAEVAVENNFPTFLIQLTNYMTSHDLDKNDIAYVNISGKYWMSAEKFFTLDTAPEIWENFAKNSMGTWDIYSKFKVVMKDWSWIEYYECHDEFYNGFRYHEPLRRSEQNYDQFTRSWLKKQQQEHATPHARTLGDFIPTKNPQVTVLKSEAFGALP